MISGKPAILIVDKDVSVRDSLTGWFEKDGYEIGSAADGVEALGVLSEHTWDIVLLDLGTAEISGEELLPQIRQLDPDIHCIMVVDHASVESAVKSLNEEIFDYVVSPVDPGRVTWMVRRALERHQLQKESLSLRTQLDSLAPEEELIGDSEEINAIRELIRTVSRADASVLVQGESGAGKELVARLIHTQSPRRLCPMVPVNCSSLPDSLLESELFGHEKESVTGAHNRHRGKLEIANGGTLFLDEVGTIDPRTQGDLLRVLETQQFTRLGGTQVISVDFRVISATNQKLEECVREKRFREDLYHRINVFPITVPPLRERRRDILLCARHFMVKLSHQLQKPVTDISRGAADLMLEYPWPGNVRELKNAVERAVIVTRGPELLPEDLPLSRGGMRRQADGDSLSAVEKAHIMDMLQQEGWNITRTAKTLGIDRVTLYNKIKKYGLRK